VALPRFFIDGDQAQQAPAPAAELFLSRDTEAYHHITHVLRLAKGEQVEIVLRDAWTAWLCEIEQLDETGVQFRYLEAIESAQLPFETTLVLGFSKGDTNERVVRQATELGVSRIIPTLFERSISRPDPKKAQTKIERLRKIAVSAAQQSHRSDLPQVEELQSFEEMLVFINALQADLIAVPWEEEQHTALSELIEKTALPELPQTFKLVLVIGPEGGISTSEIAQLRELDACSLSLGPTILRVDTAACAALAIAHDTLAKKYGSLLY